MERKQQQVSELIGDFTPWPKWLLAGQGGEVFKSPGSISWFIRKHRQRLVDSGQLILRSGPGGHYVGPRFGEVVLQILRDESATNV